MIHYSHLSHLLKTPTPSRPIVNPHHWITKLSRVLVQERRCPTGESICNGDIASTIMQGIDLNLFSEPSLNTVVAAFDKYAKAPGSLGDEARRRVITHCAALQQCCDHSPALMTEEDQSMEVGVFNSSRAIDWSLPVQRQVTSSRITEISTTPKTPNSGAYPRPSTSMASSLIARSNRFTLSPHPSTASAATLSTGDAFSPSREFSSGAVNSPVFCGVWPVNSRFRKNWAALPATPKVSTPVAERSKETPNWLSQIAHLVAQMSCQSITSEQVVAGIYSAVGGCLTATRECYTPVASENHRPA